MQIHTHPITHHMSICVSMVVIEDEDCGYDRRSHHKHYTIEISAQ